MFDTIMAWYAHNKNIIVLHGDLVGNAQGRDYNWGNTHMCGAHHDEKHSNAIYAH